jgi:hypothetical protein
MPPPLPALPSLAPLQAAIGPLPGMSDCIFCIGISNPTDDDHSGVITCREWMGDLQKGSLNRDGGDWQWLLGFLSGVAWSGTGYDPLRVLNGASAMAWVDNYCSEHPLRES